jgi:uncharacterized DUF497 family protein
LSKNDKNIEKWLLTKQIRYNYNVIMGGINFIWDEDKNQKNIKAHNVSFEEAKTVFYDPNAKIIYDPDHSTGEDRFIILGLSKFLNLLIVCHCYREKEEQIRIFSARKATKNEEKQYGGNTNEG